MIPIIICKKVGKLQLINIMVLSIIVMALMVPHIQKRRLHFCFMFKMDMVKIWILYLAIGLLMINWLF